ncbi:MAG TPA: excalibur calcium-binding domain-containing protein [Oryzihumus sp.]|nr:excalibur calcium-binding domain-containing protein [Oryzihumus sp.]
MNHIANMVLAGLVVFAGMAAPSSQVTLTQASKVTTFKSCTQLNQRYPHGVGRTGAHDRVSGHGRPVTNFTVSNALYAANRTSDRDKDGIACEKR